MHPKIALIWPCFMAYHVARFKALHDIIGDRALGVEIVGGRDNAGYAEWRSVRRERLPIVTIFPDSAYSDLSRQQLARALIECLERNKIDAIFINSYDTFEMRAVMRWAQATRRKCLTFYDSKKNDHKRFFILEWLKKQLVKKLDGAVCGGRLSKKYLIELGLPEDRIFMKYDVVDNQFFAKNSEAMRGKAEKIRQTHQLPRRYFLSVSRFVPKKNIGSLLEAYKVYRNTTGSSEPWGLVLCGSGPEESALKTKTRGEKIKGVIFAGSKSTDELPAYYGLASCFVLASTTEQWGLVVNEAMASRLPVLITREAGASELVLEGENGHTFDPLDPQAIAQLMNKIAALDQAALDRMGEKSQNIIRTWSPSDFASSVIQAVDRANRPREISAHPSNVG